MIENPPIDKITVYTSSWCAHSLSVERFLDNNQIDVHKINIDGNSEFRARLIEINGGYASVPTLIFPDGTKMTEPSLSQLRKKLLVDQPPSLTERVRRLFGRSGQSEKL
jgi:mycoredoxin